MSEDKMTWLMERLNEFAQRLEVLMESFADCTARINDSFNKLSDSIEKMRDKRNV